MTLYFALIMGAFAILACFFFGRSKRKKRNPDILDREEKFSLLLDQSIERVFARFLEEIPMAKMFLKGETAENLKKTAKKELEPLWKEIQALAMSDKSKPFKSKYSFWLVGSLLGGGLILALFSYTQLHF
ncbi:hypothetical protein [Parachlamydia sp. AcF125]|uniref:hypothetical protein n=1 Tax=Parachlamydia sp. AcF125 TaxID=2795736 RepID=UPI001BC99A73|nr:hypothetical protein [Parachlamydia sp. AcF125]MBS4167657.1 hypothetical protein [Parachlamydia sp. AcF125]